jgi:hypothetical protein
MSIATMNNLTSEQAFKLILSIGNLKMYADVHGVTAEEVVSRCSVLFPFEVETFDEYASMLRYVAGFLPGAGSWIDMAATTATGFATSVLATADPDPLNSAGLGSSLATYAKYSESIDLEGIVEAAVGVALDYGQKPEVAERFAAQAVYGFALLPPIAMAIAMGSTAATTLLEWSSAGIEMLFEGEDPGSSSSSSITASDAALFVKTLL